MTNLLLRPLFIVCLLTGSLFAQYDLLLKGGHLIDAKNEIDGPRTSPFTTAVSQRSPTASILPKP